MIWFFFFACLTSVPLQQPADPPNWVMHNALTPKLKAATPAADLGTEKTEPPPPEGTKSEEAKSAEEPNKPAVEEPVSEEASPKQEAVPAPSEEAVAPQKEGAAPK